MPSQAVEGDPIAQPERIRQPNQRCLCWTLAINVKLGIRHLVLDLGESCDGDVHTLVPIQRARVSDQELAIAPAPNPGIKELTRGIIANGRTLLRHSATLGDSVAP